MRQFEHVLRTSAEDSLQRGKARRNDFEAVRPAYEKLMDTLAANSLLLSPEFNALVEKLEDEFEAPPAEIGEAELLKGRARMVEKFDVAISKLEMLARKELGLES